MLKTTRALSVAHPLADWTAADMQGPAVTVSGVTVTEYLEPGHGVAVALETDETVPLSDLPAVAAHLLALAVGADTPAPTSGFTHLSRDERVLLAFSLLADRLPVDLAAAA